MEIIRLILLVFALVFFVIASFGIGLPRITLGWLGAACFTLAVLLGGALGPVGG